MTLIKILLLSLFVFIQAKADTIYNLIKIPNLEIYEINTSNKLRYLYAKQSFTIGIDNNITRITIIIIIITQLYLYL